MNFPLMKLVILSIVVERSLTQNIIRSQNNTQPVNATQTTNNEEMPINASIAKIMSVVGEPDQVNKNTTVDELHTVIRDNTTDQINLDRISSHTKRGIPSHPPRIPPFPNHLFAPLSQHHHRHPRSYFGTKPRRKHRRARRKPSTSSSPSSSSANGKLPKKSAHKRPPANKPPIRLSEMVRAMNAFAHTKLKGAAGGSGGEGGSIIGPYIEEDEIETIPFSPIHSVDAYPPMATTYGKFGSRPPALSPTFDLHHDEFVHDDTQPPPIEEEIIVPGPPNMRPFLTGVVRRPVTMGVSAGGGSISSWPPSVAKPPATMYAADEDYQDSVRSVRVARPQQHNNLYVDKDIVNLLAKIKNDELNADAKRTPSVAAESTFAKGDGSSGGSVDINAAISKLLQPFLSDTAIKQIQSYFGRLAADKQHDERNVTKVVYIIENESKSNESTDGQYKTFSITEPLYENGTNNTTYFIMVKSPESTNSSGGGNSGDGGVGSTTSYTDSKKHTSSHGKRHSQPRITTTPGPESIALQNYIMSLAGISYAPANYLPHFNSFQKTVK